MHNENWSKTVQSETRSSAHLERPSDGEDKTGYTVNCIHDNTYSSTSISGSLYLAQIAAEFYLQHLLQFNSIQFVYYTDEYKIQQEQ